MANVCIVPSQDWEVIRKYIYGQSGAILVPEHALDAFSQEQQDKLRKLATEGNGVYYNFGGEPDFVVDFLLSPDSYAAGILLEENNDD